MLIAVTGANGFVGRAVCERLNELGHSVRPLVRTMPPAPGTMPPETVGIGDIHGDTDWRAALTHVDVVVHCAARVHVMDEHSADPLAAFRTVNVEGSRQLADQAAAAGVRRLVFVSSLKVLGEHSPPGQAFHASDTPHPVDAYGQSKWEAEAALKAVAGRTGLQVVIVRPPLVYGPGVKANFLRLVQAVARGVPLPLGRIDNRRSLVSLCNLADVIALACVAPAAAGEALLVSDGVDASTPELVQAIGHAMGRPARLLPVPVAWLRLAGRLSGRSADVERLTGSLQVDIRHTREVLGWTPRITLQQGLQSVVQDFLK